MDSGGGTDMQKARCMGRWGERVGERGRERGREGKREGDRKRERERERRGARYPTEAASERSGRSTPPRASTQATTAQHNQGRGEVARPSPRVSHTPCLR
eukprot:9468281-Pyramimonas_sp.AAC.1